MFNKVYKLHQKQEEKKKTIHKKQEKERKDGYSLDVINLRHRRYL